MKKVILMCVALVCVASLYLFATACNRDNSIDITAVTPNLDLDINMFSLDDVVYTMPVHFSELTANVWEPFSYQRYILKPGEWDSWRLAHGERYIFVVVENFTEEAIPGTECYVTGISVLESMTNTNAIFPGNIMLGSSYEDLVAAYGEPSRTNTYDEWFQCLFPEKDGISIEVRVDADSNRVFEIDMSYYGYLRELHSKNG